MTEELRGASGPVPAPRAADGLATEMHVVSQGVRELAAELSKLLDRRPSVLKRKDAAALAELDAEIAALRDRLVDRSVPSSKGLAGWKYGWAKGWPEVWTYPSRPRPIPAAEGRAVITNTGFYWRSSKERVETTTDADRAAGRRTYEERETKRETNKWQARQTARRSVCEQLRRAAWYVRRHWSRDGDTWVAADAVGQGWQGRPDPETGEVDDQAPPDGCPVLGMAVIDPLDLFNEIDGCCADAAIRPTTGGRHGNVAVLVRRCKRHKICPVCSHQDSQERGERATVIAGRTGRPGAILHMALTHRDAPPGEETCARAHDRYECAWQRLRTGENGKWLAANVYGFVMNLETTNGRTGLSWHPHAHFILELREGIDVATFRDELAARWTRCTTLAAIKAGMSRNYIDELAEWRRIVREEGARLRAEGSPRTGLESLEAMRWAKEMALRAVEAEDGWDRASGWKDGRERWCETIGSTDEEVRSACRQAAKYPNRDLGVDSPARLAEWVQWAHGRRLTRWGGEWAREEVQEWIDEQVAYTAEEYHAEQVKLGNRPDLGKPLRGYQQTVSTVNVEQARAASGDIWFEQLGVWRHVADVDDVRGWWQMFGEMRLALRAARKQLDSDDDPKAGDYVTLAEVLRAVRLLPFAEARPAWRRIQAEIERSGPFGG